MSYPTELAPGAHPELTRGAHPGISPRDLTQALTRDHPGSLPGELSLYARQVCSPGQLTRGGVHLGSQPMMSTRELTQGAYPEVYQRCSPGKLTRRDNPASSPRELIRGAHPQSLLGEAIRGDHSGI